MPGNKVFEVPSISFEKESTKLLLAPMGSHKNKQEPKVSLDTIGVQVSYKHPRGVGYDDFNFNQNDYGH